MHAAYGQQRTNADPSTPDRPPIRGRFRPALSLQNALKIAESYIETEHIDISTRWLLLAHFILVGDKKTADQDKIACWHFVWVSEYGGFGDDVEIVVTMDGKASRAPSM
jgi:hypothetical protein